MASAVLLFVIPALALAQINRPVLSSISPTSTTAGVGVTLTLNGSNFSSSSHVLWNGTAQTTHYVSNTKLTALISNALVGTAGKATVAVSAGILGGSSTSLWFTINPAPVTTTTTTSTVTPLAITTTSLPGGTAGTAYSATLAASGGTTPYSWSLASGISLPAGLTLASSGAISGTPTAGGSYSFTAQVTDSASHSASYTYSLTVGASTTSSSTPLAITTTLVPGGTAGTLYSAGLVASGGTSPYSWSLASGSSLPAGLALRGSGAIWGMPTAGGSYSFTTQVVDSTSHSVSYMYSMTIIPLSCPSGSTATLHSNGLGQSYLDCHLLGISSIGQSYTATMATEARSVWPYEGTVTDDTISCGDGMAVRRHWGNVCAIWIYSGTSAGFFYEGANCACPGATAVAGWN